MHEKLKKRQISRTDLTDLVTALKRVKGERI